MSTRFLGDWDKFISLALDHSDVVYRFRLCISKSAMNSSSLEHQCFYVPLGGGDD